MKDQNNKPITEEEFTKGESVRVEMPVKKCEAKYGNIKCNNLAMSVVISQGVLFGLCKDCAKLARKQLKNNNLCQ